MLGRTGRCVNLSRSAKEAAIIRMETESMRCIVRRACPNGLEGRHNLMDPNLFHLDWGRTVEATALVVVLSFFVERACAVLFESRWWISHFEDARVGKPAPDAEKQKKVLPGQRYPLKELLAFLLGAGVCWSWDFDALSIIMLSEQTQLIGILVTAGVVGGGTKGSMALFQGVLGIKSSAAIELKNLQKLKS